MLSGRLFSSFVMFLLVAALAHSVDLREETEAHPGFGSRIMHDIDGERTSGEPGTARVEDEERHVASFSFPVPTILEKDDMLRIEMEEIPGMSRSYTFIEEKPLLPKYTQTITFPFGTQLLSSGLVEISMEEIYIDSVIEPAVRSQPHLSPDHWEGADELFFDGREFVEPPAVPLMDAGTYGSESLYPDRWYEVRTGTGREPSTDELVLFVMVDFYPVRYSPGTGKLKLAGQSRVEVITLPPIKTRDDERTGFGTDMVLIGPESMRAAAAPLAEFKSSTGLDTSYISLDEIYNSAFFPVQGSDNPEKIKYFIRDALGNWDIKYVCLIGDSDICPVRNAYVPDGFDDNGANHLDGRDVPSDAYYADIYNSSGAFSGWNENGNGRYGEEDDGLDLFYDVYVGRLPAGTTTELTDMVDDIIYYERNTLGSDWFLRANLHGMDTFGWDSQGIPEGEYTLDQIEERGYLAGFDITKYYETEGTLSTNAVVNGMNAGAGFAAFSDHGDHHCWGATGGGNGIFDNDDTAGLTNGHMLPVVTFDACLCGSFDNELQPTLWTDHPGESISERLLLNTQGGGIAVISATRVGYGDGGDDYAEHRSGFIDIHLYRSFQEGRRTPGRMLAGAVTYYLTDVGNHDTMDHKTLTEYICLGDPSLSIGGLPLESSVTAGSAEIKPGASGMFTVNVDNLSPFGESATIDFSRLPEGFSGAAAQSTPVIPGGSTNISFSITPPSGLLAGSIYNVPVGVLCRGRGQFHNFTCIIGEEYGVSLSSPLTDDTTDPGAEVPFWVNVRNQGNTEDTFDLGFLEDLTGWDVWAATGNITLPAYSSEDVTIYIRPGNESRFGMRRITVTATSLGSNGTVMANQKFNLTIRHIHGISVGEVERTRVYPGDHVYLDVPLHNLGNGEDRFDLEVLSRPENWTASLSQYAMDVEAFSSENATVEVSVPSDALAGSYDMELKVRSDDGNIEKQVEIGIDVLKVFDIGLGTTAYEAATENLRTVNYTLDILNGGNFEDDFIITVENLSANLSFELSDTEKRLVPGEEADILLGITPGEKALAGDYAFTVRAVSTTNSSYQESLAMQVTVNESFGSRITPQLDEIILAPGTGMNVSFEIENIGNKEDEIYLSCLREPAVLWEIGLPLVRFKAFSKDSGTLRLTASAEALAGTYEVNLTARSSAGTLELPDAWAVITVEVLPVYNVSVSPGYMEKDMDGGVLAHTFFVTNRGNCPDEYMVEYGGSAAGWLVGAARNLTVGARTDEGLVVNLVRPDGTDGGDYELEIIVRSATDGTVRNNATLLLSVPDEGVLGGFFDTDSASNLVIMGAGAVVFIILLLIVILLLVRRRSRRKKERDVKKTAMPSVPFEEERPAPSYHDLYGDLPKIAPAGGGGGQRRRPIREETYEDHGDYEHYGTEAEDVEVEEMGYDDEVPYQMPEYEDTRAPAGASLWDDTDEVEYGERSEDGYGEVYEEDEEEDVGEEDEDGQEVDYGEVFGDVLFGDEANEEDDEYAEVVEDDGDAWPVGGRLSKRSRTRELQEKRRRKKGRSSKIDRLLEMVDEDDNVVAELEPVEVSDAGRGKHVDEDVNADDRLSPLPKGSPLDSLFDFGGGKKKDEGDAGEEEEDEFDEDEYDDDYDDEDYAEEVSVAWD